MIFFQKNGYNRDSDYEWVIGVSPTAGIAHRSFYAIPLETTFCKSRATAHYTENDFGRFFFFLMTDGTASVIIVVERNNGCESLKKSTKKKKEKKIGFRQSL